MIITMRKGLRSDIGYCASSLFDSDPDARGTGVGSQILELFERQLHYCVAKELVRFF